MSFKKSVVIREAASGWKPPPPLTASNTLMDLWADGSKLVPAEGSKPAAAGKDGKGGERRPSKEEQRMADAMLMSSAEIEAMAVSLTKQAQETISGVEAKKGEDRADTLSAGQATCSSAVVAPCSRSSAPCSLRSLLLAYLVPAHMPSAALTCQALQPCSDHPTVLHHWCAHRPRGASWGDAGAEGFKDE